MSVALRIWNNELKRYVNFQKDDKYLINSKDNTMEFYSGYLDKNEKDIWENDIVRIYDKSLKPYIDIIICENKVFKTASDKQCLYHHKPKKVAIPEVTEYFQLNNFEVIGNIHEHPQLVPNLTNE